MSSISTKGGTTNSTSSPYALIWQTSGTYTYMAKAMPGSLSASAVWQAFRFDDSEPGSKKYADGNSNFDNVATDLTLLSYS